MENEEDLESLGEKLYDLIYPKHADMAPKLTGMLLELPESVISQMLQDEALLTKALERALAALHPDSSKSQSQADVDSVSSDSLGEQLYELINLYNTGYTQKITGMLLEQEKKLVFQLLSDPVLLEEKVNMALKTLQGSSCRQNQGENDANDGSDLDELEVVGEKLFALVQDIEPAHCADITAIEKIILEMTNLEGFRKYGDSWKRMDETDLHAYLGLLILAGVYRSRGEAAASLWDAENGRPIFRATMPLKLFYTYSRMLRFDNRESRPARRVADKLAAIREVWDKWVERLPYLYNPGPDVTVDEQLVPFRGRCPFRQYMPSKPARYGIKLWVACDAKSSYAWKMQVYTGKPTSGGPEKNQGMRVVLDMTEGLRGHNVTCDNFFTSYELGQQLLKRKITMVGTVRKNKPELPPALLASKEREVFSSKFAFTPTTTLVSYLPKKNKNVVLLSTLHRDASISDRADRKPAIILDYNSNKGGVDNLDKVVGTYSCRRMTAYWPLVIFHNIIDVSSYNAFVIWREINPNWMPHKQNKRRVFLEQLGKALVTPLIERRKHVPRTDASAAVVKGIQTSRFPHPPDDPATTATAPAGANKRKRCQFCPPKKDCKTHTVCCRCQKYICKSYAFAYCPTCAK
ncbi:piggyBac transposable element-derived protein 4 isoform X2 [Neoarius graeffei]|uniref:piggyBac transposable element-derived protein 4 isoform X2 n=1 Tax=Neoarius graeffei TaxID=443677 RepID=UPI00298CF32A|nr:piggyBac transposable element-derived protein 4 isoform X2 [Neoarius graeffei]